MQRVGNEIWNTDTAPYSLITVFLCHVVLWVFASVSPQEMKMQLLDILTHDDDISSSWFMVVLKRGLELDDEARERVCSMSLLISQIFRKPGL